MFTTFVVSTAILFLASFGILLAEKQFSLFFVQFFLLVKAINYGSYFFVSVIWFAWERNRQRRSWENGEVLHVSIWPATSDYKVFRCLMEILRM